MSVIEAKVRQRIQDLRKQAPNLLRGLRETEDHDNRGSWEASAQAWTVSVMNVVRTLLFDEKSLHRQRAENIYDSEGTHWKVEMLDALLDTLVADVDAGLVGSLRDLARAEVFDDYLDQAEAYLDAGQLGMAGSIASAVFEDTVKRACARHVEKAPEGADLEQRINALKAAGKLTKSRAAMAKGAAALRNQALHAEWSFTETEVRMSMDLTRALIADLLGG